MQSKYPLHTVQRARVNKIQGAVSGLLRRLEQEADLAAKAAPVFRQDSGGAQQARRMGVVAAGVHHALCLGAVFHIVVFLNRESVDIRPQRHDTASCLFTMQDPQHTCLANTRMGNAKTVQFPLDRLCCAGLLQGQFRMTVKLPAQTDKVFLLNLLSEWIHHQSPSFF